MSETIGPAIQSITDGRLTFKKGHLEYLGKPGMVDITYGPGSSILIHEPSRRVALLDQLFTSETGLPDFDQNQVELRLDSLAESVPVDEQGRIRIPQVFIARAKLTEKGAKAYIIPRRRSGWLEVWNDKDFEIMVDNPSDLWQDALNRLVLRRRGERAQDPEQ